LLHAYMFGKCFFGYGISQRYVEANIIEDMALSK
jgi:hypothetical protein